MPTASHKKIILRRTRTNEQTEIYAGYLPLTGFVRNRVPQLTIDLLDLGGHVVPIPLAEVKLISYVRDFNLADTVNPERLTRRTFLARPRSEGLWLRLSFKTGELLEGLAPTDVNLLDNLINDAGLFLVPPDTRSNTQRIFVPRSSIAELTLLAIITSPSKKKPSVVPVKLSDPQQELFDTELPPDARPN